MMVSGLGGSPNEGGRHHVFVEGINRAEISQVPVEFRAAGEHAGRDRGHHDVAAIARIARHGELPRAAARRLGCERDREYIEDTRKLLHQEFSVAYGSARTPHFDSRRLSTIGSIERRWRAGLP